MERRDLLKSAAAAGVGVMTTGASGYMELMAAQQNPLGGAPVGDFDTFELGDFTLLSGEVLRSATLAYKTHGELTQPRTRYCLSHVVCRPTHEQRGFYPRRSRAGPEPLLHRGA